MNQIPVKKPPWAHDVVRPDVMYCFICCDYPHSKIGQYQINEVGAGAERFYPFMTLPLFKAGSSRTAIHY